MIRSASGYVQFCCACTHLCIGVLYHVTLDLSLINIAVMTSLQAYNVALTRFHEVWQPVRQKHIAPMADMVSIVVCNIFCKTFVRRSLLTLFTPAPKAQPLY
jgi:hypothetical protein